MSYLVQLISVMLYMKNEIRCRKQNIPFMPNILPVKHQALLRNCISNCCTKRRNFFVSDWRESIKSLTYEKKNFFFLPRKQIEWFFCFFCLQWKYSAEIYCCVPRMKSYVLLFLACLMKCGKFAISVEMKTAEWEK